MKTLIVGDIHGCYIEFQELISMSGIADNDAIIALGDIVDRGPESPQVLDFFRQHPNARSLMGNHERKHVRASRGEINLALSQIITSEQIGDTYPDAIIYMEKLPTWIEFPEAILVHGYLEPEIPLEKQLATVLCGTIGGEIYLQSRYDRPWYELYTGSKPVIVGHRDYQKNEQAFIYKELIFGLDTSCVHGKKLTGLVLPDFTIISVPSRGDHWFAIHFQYQQKSLTSRMRKPDAGTAMPTQWDEESDRLLVEILDFVNQENARVFALLMEKPGFENLTNRQKALAYAEEIVGNVLAPLLHLARRGELDIVRARRLVKDSNQIIELAKEVGLR